MKITFLVLAIGGVLIVGGGISWKLRLAYHRSSSTPSQVKTSDHVISLSLVLKAHGGQRERWQRFRQQATMLYYKESVAGSPSLVERRLELSRYRSFVKYERAMGDWSQRFLFDGDSLIRTTFRSGKQLESKTLEDDEAKSIKSHIATFGLLPILRRIADPGMEVVYLGATSKGGQFQLKSATGSWYFYTGPDHLIYQLEGEGVTIVYSDYRLVDGLNLPFHQSVKRGDRKLYEIRFDMFDLNPSLDDTFSQR